MIQKYVYQTQKKKTPLEIAWSLCGTIIQLTEAKDRRVQPSYIYTSTFAEGEAT